MIPHELRHPPPPATPHPLHLHPHSHPHPPPPPFTHWLPDPTTRLRALLEGHLAHPSGRALPSLWMAYVRLECAQGDYGAAKRVFYRAIHVCGWCKGVWGMVLGGEGGEGGEGVGGGVEGGGGGLRGAFTTAEVKDLWRLAVDRGLHWRTV